MSAFFIAKTHLKDGSKFGEYAQKAGATIKQHGGEPILRGKSSATSEDSAEYVVGVVTFPSKDVLLSWFSSDAYQALIPLRDEACDMQIEFYEPL